MNNSDKITIIANQLANAGKKPTIALIKAKLSSPVPLPQIIATLKNWQHDPENCHFSTPVEEQDLRDNQDEIDLTNENKVALAQLQLVIDNALAPIKSELAEVKALLKQLNNQNKTNN